MAKQIECQRCSGKGNINAYAHVQGGVCFRCNGTGKVNAPRAYKPKAADMKKATRELMTEVRYEYIRRQMFCNPLVWLSPRMPEHVTIEHPYAYAFAQQVIEYHDKFGWEDAWKSA